MPAETVNLNEITSIKGNPADAYGSTPGGNDAVLAFSPAIQFLSYAARAKAEANQFKYLQFQQNLKDYYKNFDEIKVDGLMPKDYPSVTEDYRTLAGEIARNYDVIRNPMKDPDKYAELKEREAALRGKIQRSKQDLAYVSAHSSFIQAHPEFNTEQNKAAVTQFENSDMGARQPFTLTTPFDYNPVSRAKVANEVAQKKLTEQRQQGRYLVKEDAISYVQQEYDNAWDALGASQDKTGRTVNQAAADAYTKLDPKITQGKDFNTIDRMIGRNLMLQDSFVKTLTEDPVKAQEDQQAFQRDENAKNRNLQRELSADKDVIAAGRDYNEALTSGFTTGFVRPQLLQGLYGDNSDVTLKQTTYDANQNPTETSVKVPKIQVTGSELQNGELIIHRVDNSSGKPVPTTDVVVSFDEAREGFKNLAGPNNAGKVADAAERYRKANNLGENPDLEKMKKHFNFGKNKTIGGL